MRAVIQRVSRASVTVEAETVGRIGLGYLALVCAEAGALVVDADGRDLVVREGDGRRAIVAAATAPLLDDLLGQRDAFRPARPSGPGPAL